MVEAIMVGVDSLGGRRRTADRMVLDALALLILRHLSCGDYVWVFKKVEVMEIGLRLRC
jgi:hypothetical protein